MLSWSQPQTPNLEDDINEVILRDTGIDLVVAQATPPEQRRKTMVRLVRSKLHLIWFQKRQVKISGLKRDTGYINYHSLCQTTLRWSFFCLHQNITHFLRTIMSNLCFEFWLIFLIFKLHCVSCALVALASGSNEESA